MSDFKLELEVLLEKYDAELMIETEQQGYHTGRIMICFPIEGKIDSYLYAGSHNNSFLYKGAE